MAPARHRIGNVIQRRRHCNGDAITLQRPCRHGGDQLVANGTPRRTMHNRVVGVSNAPTFRLRQPRFRLKATLAPGSAGDRTCISRNRVCSASSINDTYTGRGQRRWAVEVYPPARDIVFMITSRWLRVIGISPVDRELPGSGQGGPLSIWRSPPANGTQYLVPGIAQLRNPTPW